MAGDPNDDDDMFRVQVTKEVCFMNQDVQERGFECMVEHHDIECVISNDDCIEVPPPSVHRSICERVEAQSPVEVVLHIGVERRVIRVICADVVKVSCVMEVMLYAQEWSLALKLLQLLTHTLMASRS
jgi:hypothetical protein